MMVGEGASKQRLKEKANQMELQNVRFFPLVPYEELNELLNCASIHLVLQKKGATDLVMPSKLGGILAAGGFVIVGTDGASDLHDLIETNQIGKCIPPEDETALEKGILECIKADKQTYKDNARNFAMMNLSKEGVLYRFNQNIQRLSLEK
jgi:colanic acid biosynthesis glycosyl transferase WcaI